MKKNIILTSTLLLLLSSCGGKTSNLVSFTKPVGAEESGASIALPAQQTLHNWDNNNIGTNISLDPSHNKFKTHSIKLHRNISAQPVIIDGKIIFLTREGAITALDESSLKQLWHTDLINKDSKSDFIEGGITHHAGKLFVTNGSRKFDIIDINNGNVLFSKQFPDLLITTPVLYENSVVLQTVDNHMYLFDLTKNILAWDNVGNSEVLRGGLAVDPVIDEKGRAIISYTSGQVTLLDLKNKAELWQMDLSINNTMPEYVPVNIAVTPIIEGDHVYLADNNGKLLKADMNNGHVVWSKEIDDVRTINNGVNALFVTTNGRQAIAIDKMNGKIIWATNLSERGKARSKWDPIDYAASIMMNDMISIYTSDGENYILRAADGAIVKRSNITKPVDFVTVTDAVRLFAGKKMTVSEAGSESRFKLFDKFKSAPKEEEITVAEPKQEKEPWSFKPFKLWKANEQQDDE